MGEESLFLCLQNGLNVEKEAAQEISMERIARGVTNNGSQLIRPGHIRHTGLGDTVIGYLSEKWQPRISKLAETMTSAGLPTTVTSKIDEIVLSKVLTNVGINAIGAITRQRNGELVRNVLLKDLMRFAIEEAMRVVAKLGTSTVEDIVEKTFRIAEATAENKNSMLQDVENGRRTEIDFINGAIVRIGEETGVPTPVNSTLTTLVKGIDQSSRKTGQR
jgi:2-dehydropantoate 2-reductase